ncbi:MAG: hypothetical protein ABW168_28585, partial [Sedimenticola sp.]
AQLASAHRCSRDDSAIPNGACALEAGDIVISDRSSGNPSNNARIDTPGTDSIEISNNHSSTSDGAVANDVIVITSGPNTHDVRNVEPTHGTTDVRVTTRDANVVSSNLATTGIRTEPNDADTRADNGRHPDIASDDLLTARLFSNVVQDPAHVTLSQSNTYSDTQTTHTSGRSIPNSSASAAPSRTVTSREPSGNYGSRGAASTHGHSALRTDYSYSNNKRTTYIGRDVNRKANHSLPSGQRFVAARKKKLIAYHIGNIDTDVTKKDFLDFLQSKEVVPRQLNMFSSRNSTSAKLVVYSDIGDRLESSDFWPPEIVFRRWMSKQEWDRELTERRDARTRQRQVDTDNRYRDDNYYYQQTDSDYRTIYGVWGKKNSDDWTEHADNNDTTGHRERDWFDNENEDRY